MASLDLDTDRRDFATVPPPWSAMSIILVGTTPTPTFRDQLSTAHRQFRELALFDG
jgi:hypothetical protein